MAAGADTPRLFNTLITLLKLRPGPKKEPDLSYTIQPIIDVAGILQDYKVSSANADLQAAAGTYVPMITVPAKKRWTLLFYITTGTTAASRVRASVAGSTFQLGLAAQTAAERTLCERFKLGPGDTIGRDTTGNALDNSQDLTVWYIEEDFVP